MASVNRATLRVALDTPLSAAIASAREHPGVAWLDGDGRASGGRFSYVACEPVESLRIEDATIATLGELAHAIDAPGSATHAPRWIGYLGYDLGQTRGSRAGPEVRAASACPVAHWARYDAVACFDHATGDAWIDADDDRAATALASRLATRAHTEEPARAEPRSNSGPVSPHPASPRKRGEGPRVDGSRVNSPPRTVRPEQTRASARVVVEGRECASSFVVRSDVERDAHIANIQKALAHIAAGDVYQVNVTRRLSLSPAPDSFALALAMRATSPVPYGVWLDAGDHAVVGRSMELFLRWDRTTGELVTMPIKGTLAHVAGQSADEAAAQLRADPKEHAEHVMIVDMARNDLGRVAVVGSVEVPIFLEVERFAGLDHLVSTVRCRTSPGATLAEVLSATFPGASITGAPKVAAMRLIAAIEPSPRGLYTGAYGYVAGNGSVVLAMAIRTAVVREGVITYGTGGGIVAASDPAREWDETELKARALTDALELSSEHARSADEEVERRRLVHAETPSR